MKVYTKKGDKGETSLIGGVRVSKDSIRIEAYGTVDELNSFIGMIRDYELDKDSQTIIVKIQEDLFTLGAMLASKKPDTKMKLPEINEMDINALENEIDKMETSLPPMKNFILPGGHPSISACHTSRSICRRAERNVITLSKEEKIDERIVKYLNRSLCPYRLRRKL